MISCENQHFNSKSLGIKTSSRGSNFAKKNTNAFQGLNGRRGRSTRLESMILTAAPTDMTSELNIGHCSVEGFDAFVKKLHDQRLKFPFRSFGSLGLGI